MSMAGQAHLFFLVSYPQHLVGEGFATGAFSNCRAPSLQDYFFPSNSSLHSALKSHWVPAQQCFNF